MNLRDIDDRYVPALARLVQRASAPLDRFRRPEPLPAPARPRSRTAPDAAGPAPVIVRLRGVDDRYAGRGPLGLLRDIPQLGYLAIGAIVLVGGATALQRSQDVQARSGDDQVVGTLPGGEDGAGDPGEASTRVGPPLGVDVVAYLGDAQAELRGRADEDGDERAWSVVSFERYLTPQQVASTVAGVQPSFVIFRVPPKPGDEVSVGETALVKADLVRGAQAAFALAARARADEAVAADKLARESANDPAYQKDYLNLAAQKRREAAALGKQCACVYAVIVNATADELLSLSRKAGVRTVDIGPADAEFADLEFRGLLPEEKVTVTAGNEGSPGGNG